MFVVSTKPQHLCVVKSHVTTAAEIGPHHNIIVRGNVMAVVTKQEAQGP